MRQKWILTAFTLSVMATIGTVVWLEHSRTYANTSHRQVVESESNVGVLEIYTRNDAGEPLLRDEFNEFEATAYSVSGITYSGVAARRGIVAADPEILPIGSVIEIQAGDYSGVYTVMDTGAVIRGRLIDIYMPEYEEAIQFGRQKVRVRVIRHGWQPDLAFGYTVAG